VPRARINPTGVVAVSTVATGLGAYLGFVPGFLAPVLQADLDLTRTELGVLIRVFYGATAIGSPLAGRLADRVGARLAVTLDLLLVAAALAGGVIWPVYPVLLAGAIVAGLGYALTNGGTNLAVAVAVPVRRHGVALATKTAGVPLLVAVSAPIAAAVGEAVGWRPVYLATVPLVLLAAAAAAWALPDARHAGTDPLDTDPLGTAPARGLPRSFLWFPIAAFLLVSGSQPLYSWIVAYLHEVGGAPLPLAGVLTALGSIAGVAGMVVAALRSDRVAGASRIPAVVVLCLAAAFGEGLLLAGVLLGTVPMVAGLLLATAAQLSAIGLMHAAVVAAVPHAVGRASGVTMAGYYVGALIGAPVFGAVVDVTGSYAPAWTVSLLLVLAGTAAFTRCRGIGGAAGGRPAPAPRSGAASPQPIHDPRAGG
jgi:predicted MFS family arabinose efflux permease